MNHRLYRYLFALLVGVALKTDVSAQVAQNVPIGSPIFSGHAIETAEVAKKEKDIVVARFINLGYPQAGATGVSIFVQSRIRIISALKGTLSGEIPTNYQVWVTVPSCHEEMPIVGVDYIMVIHKREKQESDIRKILPLTAANLAKVKSILNIQ